MPRRSARNIAKDIEIQEEPVSNNDSKQSPPGVVEVIDEFVSVAENQEGLENHDDTSKDIDIVNDQKETTDSIRSHESKIENKHEVESSPVALQNETTEEEEENQDGSTEVEYHCPVCSKVFDKHNAFYGHLRTHKGVIFRCDYDSCGEEFTNMSKLRKHQKDIHDQFKTFKCPKIEDNGCQRSFHTQSQLDFHIERIHDASRPHACKICPKAFHKRSDLKAHIRLHLGIKKNKCEDCGRSFAHVSNLYRHTRIHSKERPYVCEECGKRFLQLSGLNQHLRIHISPTDESIEQKENTDSVNTTVDGDITDGSSIGKECRVVLTRLDDKELAEHHVDGSEQTKTELLVTESNMLIENLENDTNKSSEEAAQTHKDIEDVKVSSPRKSERLAGKSFSCVKCEETFKNEGVAKGHLQSVHNTSDNSRMCTICKEVLEDEKEGKSHLFNVHPEAVNKEIKVMGVSVQGDKLSKADMSALERAVQQRDEGQSIVLNRNTLKIFQELEREARNTNGQKRKRRPHGGRKNRCTTCGKTFVKKAFLKKHMELHKEYICTRCNRDCRTYEYLLKHICVAPPQYPVKRVKRILDLTNGSSEITELLKELEEITNKGRTIKSGTESGIPSEILISIEEEQLAEFTKATIQSQIERLRMFTEVSLTVKSKHESEDSLEAFEEVEELVEDLGDEGEMNTEVIDSGAQILSPDENQIIIQEEPNGTRTLFRVSHENITNPHTKPFGNEEKDSEQKGEKEKSLDQYMEYVPDKCEQDERMASMLKVQDSKTDGDSESKSRNQTPNETPQKHQVEGSINPKSPTIKLTNEQNEIANTNENDGIEEDEQLQFIQQKQDHDMVSREIHAQPIHIEELYNQGHQVAALTEEFESQEPLQYFKVMTPIEVMAEQVEPMLTLTTDDDINWMVVTSYPQPNETIPLSTSSKEATEITKPTTVRTKLVRRRIRRPQPPKPAGPIIIDNPVDYQLALQQQQQIILGQGVTDISSNKRHCNEVPLGSNDDAKHLAEFLRPKKFPVPNSGLSNTSNIEISPSKKDVVYEGLKDNKENESGYLERSETTSEGNEDLPGRSKSDVLSENEKVQSISKEPVKPHLTSLASTVGMKKGGKYVQTKYGEVKMTEDGSKFECKVCQHTFTRIESVHQHMAIHDETLAMKCDLCNEKFAWKSTLRKHKMTVHEGVTTELTCTESNCDRVFKSFGHRKIHIKRDHLKERNHECEQCGKTFFLRDDLRTHARIHTGMKPYACNICGKTFKHISHRNRHQNTNHNGEERPYNCELCKKGFLGKTHLVTHFRRYHHDLGAHQIDTLLSFMLKTERYKPS